MCVCVRERLSPILLYYALFRVCAFVSTNFLQLAILRVTHAHITKGVRLSHTSRVMQHWRRLLAQRQELRRYSLSLCLSSLSLLFPLRFGIGVRSVFSRFLQSSVGHSRGTRGGRATQTILAGLAHVRLVPRFPYLEIRKKRVTHL